MDTLQTLLENKSALDRIFAQERAALMQRKTHEENVYPTRKEILTLLAAGAVIGLSLAIPTAPVILAPFILDTSRYDSRRLNGQLKRLGDKKFVEIVYEQEQTIVRITQHGTRRALKYKIDALSVQKPRRWDKKWRVVIFDIPEKQKRMREIFRRHLKHLGFFALQKSVWVHPYPCFDEIEFLRQVYNIGGDVTYIIGERLESTDTLKQYFHLE